MGEKTQKKTGLLLLNMGGPDSLDAVQPFLFNLFSDPDIIKLPLSAVFQKPLAYRISTKREKEAQANYAIMGGASPILKYSLGQAELLAQALNDRGYGKLPAYVAMRYWHPFTDKVLNQILADKIERLVVIPLYPHFSFTTTGSSLNELRRVMTEKKVAIELDVVPCYYDHPKYIKALAENIESGLSGNEWGCKRDEVTLVYSAHSLPMRHIKSTQDPYPDQIYETVKQVSEQYFPDNPWELAYQSQVGKMPWLGPSTEGILHYFSGVEQDNLLMIAVSFVSDHVETLVEIDQEYIPLANELEIQYCKRAPALNVNASFIEALADIAADRLDALNDNTPLPTVVPEFKSLLKNVRHPSLSLT
ncbi:MAG: ferrochelatase [Cyanobacteria bacterium P01_H01_bin.74]